MPDWAPYVSSRQTRGEIALEGCRGVGIGFLALDAPIAQVLNLYWLSGNGAANVLAFFQDLEIGIEIADARLASAREKRFVSVHGTSR